MFFAWSKRVAEMRERECEERINELREMVFNQSKAVETGMYAHAFWWMLGILLACFFTLFLQFVRRRYSLRLMMAVGLLVNVAAVLKRFLIVVPSQTHGTMLPYPVGGYVPSWIELSVVAGLIALGTLVFLFFRYDRR